MVVADPDEALIEAIAEEVRHEVRGATIGWPRESVDLFVRPIALAAYAALVEHLGRERWEYGVERGPFGDKFPAHIEWGSSDGMSHHYEYTAESVHALASGRPVFRRLVTSFRDVIGEPEPYSREVDHGSE